MKKKSIAMCIALACCLALSGCGATIPDLSETEEEEVSQYAAGLLLKYDKENHTRLVDTTDFKNAYETAKKLHDDAESMYYEQKQEEENKSKEEAEKQDALNGNNTESSTTVISDDGTGGAMVVDSETVGNLIGYPDFSFEYAGCDTMNSYPEDSGNVYLALTATTGNDLLIVYFNVTNNSGAMEELNILDASPTFKLSVNGDSYYSVLKTFVLDDDLSLYDGNFESGESKRLVLITEVSKGTEITSLGLRVSTKSGSITKSLK